MCTVNIGLWSVSYMCINLYIDIPGGWACLCFSVYQLLSICVPTYMCIPYSAYYWRVVNLADWSSGKFGGDIIWWCNHAPVLDRGQVTLIIIVGGLILAFQRQQPIRQIKALYDIQLYWLQIVYVTTLCMVQYVHSVSIFHLPRNIFLLYMSLIFPTLSHTYVCLIFLACDQEPS